MYLKYQISQENSLDFHTFWLSFAFFDFFPIIRSLFRILQVIVVKYYVLCTMLYALFLCSSMKYIYHCALVSEATVSYLGAVRSTYQNEAPTVEMVEMVEISSSARQHMRLPSGSSAI